MMRKILPIMLALMGLGGGVGAGLYLRPEPEAQDAEHGAAEHGSDAQGAEKDLAATSEDSTHAEDGEHADEATAPEYVKLSNQFVVPVVDQGRVSAMVVLSLSLEVEAGTTEAVYQREPKLRDAFLQVLFDHANVGGFSGSFTDGSNLIFLRTTLKEAAAQTLGTVVKDVLITDIARQDS